MKEAPTVANIRACVFDAYGTLFDVHSAVGRYRADLGEKADMVSSVWRVKQLEYTWLRSLMKRHADFWQVTAEALDYALDSCGIAPTALRDRLLEAYLHLDCYPEVPAALEALKRQGLGRVILSNGAPPMLGAAVTSSGLEGLIERIFSVEEVGIFKPDPRVYRLAVEGLGLEPGRSPFCPRIPGTSPGRRPSDCGRSGSIGSARSASDCPTGPKRKSGRSISCRDC